MHEELNCCHESRVQLTGKNFEPDWGLFNGAQGTIKEIVYKENKSPLDFLLLWSTMDET